MQDICEHQLRSSQSRKIVAGLRPLREGFYHHVRVLGTEQDDRPPYGRACEITGGLYG